MKLRIRGNSVRLRLGQSEVHQLAERGTIEESTQFDLAGSQRLIYALEVVPGVAEVSASFAAGKLLVRLPGEVVRRWASSDEITIAATQAVVASGSLTILVEKDFVCIDPATDESQDDAFPRPGGGLSCPAIDLRD